MYSEAWQTTVSRNLTGKLPIYLMLCSFLAVFVMNRDGSAKLDFVQNIEFKFIELLSCEFFASSEEVVRQSITYRYNSVKSKVQLMEGRLKDVNNLVKIKNPSLLLQLQKANPIGGHSQLNQTTHSQSHQGPPGSAARRSRYWKEDFWWCFKDVFRGNYVVLYVF